MNKGAYRDPRIAQKPFGQSQEAEIQLKPSAKYLPDQKGQTPSDQLAQTRIVQALSEKMPFTLSWSHYVLLLTIKNPEERSCYEIEATRESWSVPELKRQVVSSPV